MTEERYKELMAQVGMPESRSLLQALQQAVMEATLEERERCARISENPETVLRIFSKENPCSAFHTLPDDYEN